MGYRINENKTSIVPFQSGSGAPNHLSFLGTVYVDNLTGIQYINKDGLANWAYLLDSSMPISGGTGSGGTITGAYLPLSGGTVTGPTIFTGGVSANTLSNVQWIDFSTAATVTQATGRVFYDTGEQSLSYYPDINQAVTVRVGQQLYVRVYNVSGAAIPKGSVVSVTGTSNNLPSVTLSKNNHEITSARPIGLSADNIPNNNVGLVITNGILSGITLNNFNNGDTLYLSPFSAGTYVSNTAIFPFTARTNEIGYVIQTGTTTGKIYVTINNEDSNLSLTDIERNILEGNVISSGAYQYTGMTLGIGQTINISALKGWIVKNTYDYATLPDVTNINYTGGTNIPLTYLSAASATYLLINSASTLTQQITFPTPQERRQNILIGKVVHPNNTTITSLNQTVDFDVSPMAAIRDLWTPIKLINQGITVSPHSTTLEINTSAGTLWGNGIGWTTNQLNPDSVSLSATSPTTFQYRTQTGGTFSNTTTIDCTHYDVNGVVTVIPGNNGSQLSRATNQRVYLFPTGLIRIQYGQQWYESLTLAIAGIQNEIFNEYINNRDNGILIGIITVARSTTNLSNSTQAYFSLTSKFGELFGGTAGISTTTLQQAYDNSTTPEIVINSTLDGLTIKNGTGNADNITHLLEGQNAAGNITSFITADGTFSGSTISGGTFYGNGSGFTNFTSGQITTALNYTPVTNTRSLTINGLTYNLSTDRTWTIVPSISGSSDVSLTALTNNQLLQYNSSISKWVNVTPNYISGNQIIVLSGAITGSGTTGITTSLSTNIVGISNLTATGTPSTSTYLRGDNTWATITTSIPGGLDTYVQFNNSGSFSGSSNFIWDNTNNLLTISGNTTYQSSTKGILSIVGTNTSNAGQPVLFVDKGANGYGPALAADLPQRAIATFRQNNNSTYITSGAINNTSGLSINQFGGDITLGGAYNSGGSSVVILTRGTNHTTNGFTIWNNFNAGGTPTFPMFNITSGGNVGIGFNSGSTFTGSSSLLQVYQSNYGIGTVQVIASNSTVANITGTNTQFTNTFKLGDTITISGLTFPITAVNADSGANAMTITTTATTNIAAGTSYSLVGGPRFSVKGNGNISIGGGEIQFVPTNTNGLAIYNDLNNFSSTSYNRLRIYGGGQGSTSFNIIPDTNIAGYQGSTLTIGATYGSSITTIQGGVVNLSNAKFLNSTILGGFNVGGGITVASISPGRTAATVGAGWNMLSIYPSMAETDNTYNRYLINTGVINQNSSITNTFFTVDMNGNVQIGGATSSTAFQVSQATSGIGTITISGTTITGAQTQFTNTFKIGDTLTVTPTTTAWSSGTAYTIGKVVTNGGNMYNVTTAGTGGTGPTGTTTTATQFGGAGAFFTYVAPTYTISAIASDTSMTISPTATLSAASSYTLTGGSRFNVYGNGNVAWGTPGIGGTSSTMWWDARYGALNIGTATQQSTYLLNVNGAAAVTTLNGLTLSQSGGNTNLYLGNINIGNGGAAGTYNMNIGFYGMRNTNSSSQYNIGIGYFNFQQLTSGTNNVSIMPNNGAYNLTSGSYNTLINAGPWSNISNSTLIGYAAYTTSNNTVGVGFQASTGPNGISIGYQAGGSSGSSGPTGTNNILIGFASAISITTASYTLAIGTGNGNLNSNLGTYNTLLGHNISLYYGGSYNTFIGSQINVPTAVSNNIVIADGQGNQRIYGFSTGNISIGAGNNPTDDTINKLQVSGSGKFTGNLTVSGSVTMPNRPAFRVYGSSSSNISSSTTLTSTQGATVDYNQGSNYNNTTGIFTAPVAGLYSVFMNLRTGTANSQMQAILLKNNTTSMLMWEAAGNTGATHFGVSAIISLAANDTLRINVTVGSLQFDGNDSWGATYIG